MIKDILIGPHQVSFDITNKCNLRCLHCYNNSGENYQSTQELSDQEVIRFIDDFKDIKLLNLCFCGGETLLRKNLILKCAEKLKIYKCENISMVTNGLLLDEDTLKELIHAGVNRIQVSLDGFKAESHDKLRNKQGVFEKAIKAINLISQYDVDLSVAFTPTNFNLDELESIHTFLHKLSDGKEITLRAQPLMVMGRASDNVNEIKPSVEQYRKLVNDIRRINQQNRKPRIEWGDPIDHLIRFRNMDMVINNIMVRANGEVIVDPYLPLVLGNIRKHSFLEYWNHGINKIWNHQLIIKLAENIMSIDDMDITYDNIPKIWKDKDIYIDIIDDDFNSKAEDILNCLNKI